MESLTSNSQTVRTLFVISCARELCAGTPNGRRVDRDDIAFYIACVAQFGDVKLPNASKGWTLLVNDVFECCVLIRNGLL